MDSVPESFAVRRQPDRQNAEREPPSIPDHELSQRIGAGAYGEVWLARNLATGALRAVKVVHRSTFTDDRPFNREFEGIKKFDAISRSHPSQLALFHVGRNDAAGYFYYVMELADNRLESRLQAVPCDQVALRSEPVKGGEDRLKAGLQTYAAYTLRADLEQGRLPAARVLELALALTEALAHLHANALIHRDVKPSNIIFVNGRPKLADIGLVTDASDSRSIVGTEGYLPREGPGTPAADIFALGEVLYEALTGLDRRQYPELPADLRRWPDAALAFELNSILVKACSADLRQRYANTEAMLADLKLLDAGKSVRRRRSVQRGWAWTWKTAAAIALVATLGQIYGATHRFPEALAALGDAIRLEPSRPDAFSNRGELHWAMGQRAEAARDWQRYVELDGFASLSREDVGPLEKALRENGPEGFLRQLIELLEQCRERGQFVSAYDLARLHAFAGNKPRALDYLELAVDEHRTYTLTAKVHLAFKNFQDEPRFHAVLRRLKLEK